MLSRPALAKLTRTKSQAREVRSVSCDDAKPLHFPVEPNAVDHEGESDNEGDNRARAVNRFAYGQIDPNAPETYPEREKCRENDKNDMETLKRHQRTIGLYHAR